MPDGLIFTLFYFYKIYIKNEKKNHSIRSCVNCDPKYYYYDGLN